MRELIFKKVTPQGNIEGTLRVIRGFVYFKHNDSETTKQVIKEYKNKGVDIDKGKNWIRIDLMKDNDIVKIGDYVLNKDRDSDGEIEDKIFDFYMSQYKKMQFYVEEIKW